MGDIVVAEKEINADEGILIDNKSFVFIDSEEISLVVPKFLSNFRKGIFLTVSSCSGSLQRAEFLEKRFNALCENMEGFSIAKAAMMNNISVMEIRSISNIVTDRYELLKLEEVRKPAKKVQEFILDYLLYFDFL